MRLRNLEAVDDLTEEECCEWLNAFNMLYEPVGFRPRDKSPQYKLGEHDLDVMRRSIARILAANPDKDLIV